MTTIVNEAVPVQWREEPFTLEDRCARCGAAGVVRTFHTGLPEFSENTPVDLLWCSHHFNDNKVKLTETALHIQDSRPVYKKVNDV